MCYRPCAALILFLLCALAACGTPAIVGVAAVAASSVVPAASARATVLSTALTAPFAAATPEKGSTPQWFSATPPPSCPVTLPPDPPFVPPATVTIVAGYGWYGTAALWTQLRRDGTWHGLVGPDGGVSNKSFWWREGFVTAHLGGIQ